MNPAIDTILTAETPEGIAISIRPAGFAVRATAFLIDAAIRIVFLMICSTALAAGGKFGGGVLLIFLFVLNWLYPVIFELTAAAATPGKRIMGLVVLMANGLPITPAGCLIRNLLRVVDALPLCYAFGIVCILLRNDSRRIGDLAGGTVVAYRDEVQPAGSLAAADPVPPPIALSRRQQIAIMSFGFRVGRLTPQRAEEIAELAAAALQDTPARLSLTTRLVGVARWLHGDRGAHAGSAAP
ncbi:MAG TPA: RDD family protein [Steroidobacteraceae bacterium]|nr:RDD family protein [Steroidobacteraceae bacterium]